MEQIPPEDNPQRTEQPKRLITIHSQKGGVGKTLIGLYLARRLSQNLGGWKPERTVFIDADLTGTSIAEGLPLIAPKEKEIGHLDLVNTRGLLKQLSSSDKPVGFLPQPNSRKVKFLNDLLVCPPEVYRSTLEDRPGGNNFSRRTLLWRIDPGSLQEYLHEIESTSTSDLELDRLRIIPSSGLPRHIAHCVPLVYKEGITEYLERRLAEIVCSLWTKSWEPAGPFDSIVIDTSPMLRGISRAVLKLHRVLVDEDRRSQLDLSCKIDRKALFVSSSDTQDLVDTGRALDEALMTPKNPTGQNNKINHAEIDPEIAVVILNRVPRNALVKGPPANEESAGDTHYSFKDDALVRQYYHAYLKSLHSPKSDLFKEKKCKGSSKKKVHQAIQFLEDGDKSFVLGYTPPISDSFVGVLHSKKILYGDLKDVPDFSRLFRGLCKPLP